MALEHLFKETANKFIEQFEAKYQKISEKDQAQKYEIIQLP